MDAAHGPGAGRQTVIAVFENLNDAERALEALRVLPVRREDISLVLREASTAAEAPDGLETMVVSGAATGATIGGLIGGLAGWLLVSLVPGIGPVLGAGVLASTLTSAAIGAAGGGIMGALLGLGVAEDEALAYAEHVQAGRVLVTVSARNPLGAQQISQTLEAANAYDVRTYAGAVAPLESVGTVPAVNASAASTPVAGAGGGLLSANRGMIPTMKTPANAASAGAGEGLPGSGLEATALPAAQVAPLMEVAPPTPPDAPATPPAGGDVASAISGGPDVRGPVGQPAIADRGLTDATPDPRASTWRSGGDATRPPDLAAPGAIGLESAAPVGVGDVVAALNDGPDVAPPQATAGLESVGPAGENAPGSWADTPSDWRSGGEAARAETGDGVGSVPATGLESAAPLEAASVPASGAPSPGAASPVAGPALDVTTGYYTSPSLLSRSALGAGGPPPAGGGATALEGSAPVERGYGDADTE